MANSTDVRFSPRRGGDGVGSSDVAGGKDRANGVSRAGMGIQPSKLPVVSTNESFAVMPAGVGEFKDRRRRRRVAVQPMYSCVNVRVLSKKGEPLDGHVLDISENGMAVQVDEQIGVGQPVALEFQVAGLGRQRKESWPTFVATAEVVRLDDLADFPMGPYRTALRFVRIATMVQAQIARFVATQPVAVG